MTKSWFGTPILHKIVPQQLINYLEAQLSPILLTINYLLNNRRLQLSTTLVW